MMCVHQGIVSDWLDKHDDVMLHHQISMHLLKFN